ncbi:MAG: FtsW/RodA/SpoVE family cell cycle protein, partial [Flavobacterium sp.]
GGVIGLGAGKSVQKNFLPQSSSDFIFAIIVEEWGLVGAVTIIGLYLLLLIRFVINAQKASSLFGKLLIIGLGFPIIFQAFVNMGVAVELLPVTGQPLPLISSGGTSIWMTCIAVGIILSVTKKEEEVALDLEEKRKRDEALQQIIDAQVALNEEKEADENQQKINDIKSSIRESLIEDENGDVLVNGQNPMNAVLNKK